MRQDIGEFVTVYQGTGFPIMVDIAGGGEELIHWLSVKNARKVAEELIRAADACRIDCKECKGTGYTNKTLDHVMRGCEACHRTGKVDP